MFLLQSSESGNTERSLPAWNGVAALLFLRRPKWYYKRYNVLVDNALANIPLDWGLQIFYEREFLSEVLQFHRGLERRLKQHPRVVLTELPPFLSHLKPNRIWKDSWVWKNAVADRVLTINGDGVLCSNSHKTWSDLEGIDYIGIPWNHGAGGDGSTHSLQSRTVVLAAMNSPYWHQLGERRFDTRLVQMIRRLNEEGSQYRLATREETEWFGPGKHQLMAENGTLIRTTDFGPLVVTGTLSDWSYETRNWVLGTCPELKAIFPSLHDPACFGARPDPNRCAISLGLPQPCQQNTTTTKGIHIQPTHTDRPFTRQPRT